MTRPYIPFLVFLVLLLLTIPFSFDFATSVVPGWHTTIYPPYFIWALILIVVLLLMKIGYWLLSKRFDKINWILFAIHFKVVWRYKSYSQQSVWHYGGRTLEQSAALRYASAVARHHDHCPTNNSELNIVLNMGITYNYIYLSSPGSVDGFGNESRTKGSVPSMLG